MKMIEAVHDTRLPNGLRVLVRPVHTAPLVSVWCWYHVGSKHEQAGLTGISHFVEHMNFKGTRNISREQLKVWIERAGGTWNGYTWIDQTTYFETLAADELELALRIEAERMGECLYDPKEFESERTVVLAELQGNRNSPEYELNIDVTAAAFRMHPYRWPTIGWQSDLETMQHQDLVDHYRRYYVPANATLVIVGDVEADRALKSVESLFGGLEPGAPSMPPEVREPEQRSERRVVVQRPGTTAYLQVAYRAPAFTHQNFVPLLLADAVLSGGKGINLWSGGFGRNARTTAPLYEALVESELVVAVSSALLPTEEPYLYEISATLREGIEHRQVERALFDALARVSEHPVPEHELRKAKNQVLASLAFESERVTEIGHQLGYFATIATLQDLERLPQRVEAASAEDVRAAAQEAWRTESRTVGWFVPQGMDT